jgi:hypothetical protein
MVLHYLKQMCATMSLMVMFCTNIGVLCCPCSVVSVIVITEHVEHSTCKIMHGLSVYIISCMIMSAAEAKSSDLVWFLQRARAVNKALKGMMKKK